MLDAVDVYEPLFIDSVSGSDDERLRVLVLPIGAIASTGYGAYDDQKQYAEGKSLDELKQIDIPLSSDGPE